MNQPETLAVSPYTQIRSCRACGSPHWDTVLHLGTHYICGFVNEVDTRLPQAPLELIRCMKCGLVQLKHSVHPDLLWKDYWYRSSTNQTMKDALADVVKVGLEWKSEGIWLDIGANDGCLLKAVPDSFTKWAVEPARTFTADLEEHADLVVADFFQGQDELVGRCDVITSCAVWYDLDDPVKFCQNVNRCLAQGGVWINQLTSTQAMLDTNGFDNVCHEHRTYPDLAVIQQCYDKAGLAIVAISENDVNGGSVRLVAMRKSEAKSEVPSLPGISFPAWHQFSERVKRWKIRMLELLDSPSVSGGGIFGYGASTKGSTLLQYLNKTDQIIAIADRNPLKAGKLTTGTWIPITDEMRLRRHQPEHVLVLPWAFRKEFDEREKVLRQNGTTFLYPLPSITLVL